RLTCAGDGRRGRRGGGRARLLRLGPRRQRRGDEQGRSEGGTAEHAGQDTTCRQRLAAWFARSPLQDLDLATRVGLPQPGPRLLLVDVSLGLAAAPPLPHAAASIRDGERILVAIEVRRGLHAEL